MHDSVVPARFPRKRYAHIALTVGLALCLPLPLAAQTGAEDAANQTNNRSTLESAPSSGPLRSTYYLNFGARFGNDGPEGYSDMILPLVNGENGILFFNPRVSLADEGQGDVSVGLGLRGMVASGLVLGAGLYADAYETRHGNRIDQWGLGLELLSDWADLRANWYDAEGGKEKIGEYSSVLTQTRSVTTATSWTDPVTSGDYFKLYARGNSIWYDAAYRVTTTYRTDTTRTRTTRWFERYEAGMDGWDAELGFRLPWSVGPETRVFGGWYAYDNPWGSDVEGWKARLEVKTGPWLSLDGELYEDDKLYGSDWFVGARLQIPLSRDLTWSQFREGLFSMRRQDLDERMRGEMTRRAARVHTAESDWAENLARRQVDVRKTRSERTETYEDIREGVQAQLDGVYNGKQIVFVSQDQGNDATGDGSAENPFASINQALTAAGPNTIVFVYDQGGRQHVQEKGRVYAQTGTTPHTEFTSSMTLQAGQVLTSRVTAQNNPYGTTTGINVTVNNLTDINQAAVTMRSGAVMEHVNLTANGNGSGSDIYGVDIVSTGSGDAIIRNSAITVVNSLGNAVGVYSDLGSVPMGNLTVENSSISAIALNGDAFGIYATIDGDMQGVQVTNNTISATGSNWAYGVQADVTSTVTGDMTVTGNTINAQGLLNNAYGIYVSGRTNIQGAYQGGAADNTITLPIGGTPVNP